MEENEGKMKKVWISIVGRGYGLKRVVLGASPWSSKENQRTLWFKLGFNRWKCWTVPEQVRVLLFSKKTISSHWNQRSAGRSCTSTKKSSIS